MIGIVILNYKTFVKTVECVESIICDSNFPNYKIYIVDNASPNNSYAFLNEKFNEYTNIKVIKATENYGFAKGNNIGIEQAISDGIETLILTNNDIIFNPHSISNLTKFIIENNSSVIVGPRIYTPQGEIQHSSKLSKTSFLEILGISFLTKKTVKEELDESNISKPHKVYSVSGCCFAISVEKFKEMGAFDENTFLYNEENILGAQAETHNYHVYFNPNASIIHDHGTTTGKQNLFVSAELLKSSLYYWRTYRSVKIKGMILIYLVQLLKVTFKLTYDKDFRNGWFKYYQKSLSYLINEIKILNN